MANTTLGYLRRNLADTGKTLLYSKLFEYLEEADIEIHNGREEFAVSEATLHQGGEMLGGNGFVLVPFQSTVDKSILKLQQSPDMLKKPRPLESNLSRAIRATMQSEGTALMKKVTGAKHVICVGMATRFAHDKEVELDNGATTKPSAIVHTDHTGKDIEEAHQLLLDLGLDEDEVHNLDVVFINMWKPATGPVRQRPLTLLDHRSVKQEDKYTAEFAPVQGASKVNRLGLVAHNTQHKWYYFPDMEVNEAVLFVQMDSRSNPVKSCFHTSFYDASRPKNQPLRQSVETRFLCAFPKEQKAAKL
jgi:hypothetical protein